MRILRHGIDPNGEGYNEHGDEVENYKSGTPEAAPLSMGSRKLFNYIAELGLANWLINRQDKLDLDDPVLNEMRFTRSCWHVLAYLALFSTVKNKTNFIQRVISLNSEQPISIEKAGSIVEEFEQWSTQFCLSMAPIKFLEIQAPKSVLYAITQKENPTPFDNFIKSVLRPSSADSKVVVTTTVTQAVEWLPEFTETAEHWKLTHGKHFKLSPNELQTLIKDCLNSGFHVSEGMGYKKSTVELMVTFGDLDKRSSSSNLAGTMTIIPIPAPKQMQDDLQQAKQTAKRLSIPCYLNNNGKKSIAFEEDKVIGQGIYKDFKQTELIGDFTIFLSALQIKLKTKGHVNAKGAAVKQEQELRTLSLSIPTRILIPIESLGLYFGTDIFMKSALSMDQHTSQSAQKPLVPLMIQTKSGPAMLVFGNRGPSIYDRLRWRNMINSELLKCDEKSALKKLSY